MSHYFQFQIGQLTCTSFVDMQGEWEMSTLFPALDPSQLDDLLARVGLSNTWVRHGSVLYVDTGRYKVLIDSGLPAARGSLIKNMREAGIEPDEIDYLFITHGDGDHIGGLASFSNSQILMPAESYRLWSEDEDRMVEEFLKLFRENVSAETLAQRKAARCVFPQSLPELGDRLLLVEPEEPFLPGFKFIPAPGHRSDHVAVEIKSDGETLLHIADGIRHPIQLLQPEIYSFLDSYPKQLAISARMLMARAAAGNALVFGAHLPFPGLIRVGQEAGQYKWLAYR
ncbi:MAG: MBL fold metallo-hydrolase [Chloroflexota bacterium]